MLSHITKEQLQDGLNDMFMADNYQDLIDSIEAQIEYLKGELSVAREKMIETDNTPCHKDTMGWDEYRTAQKGE